jgi:hypothetical protein
VTDPVTGLIEPSAAYGLMLTGSKWLKPLGRRVELRGERLCGYYLVEEDGVVCPVRRLANNETWPQTGGLDEAVTAGLASSCVWVDRVLDAVTAASNKTSRNYTELGAQQQDYSDRFHSGVSNGTGLATDSVSYVLVDPQCTN